MTVDWVAVGSMLQGVGTCAGVIAVIWGARYGANAWREQKRAERRLEMAERILTATHKARSALAGVRSPMMWGGEHEAAVKFLEENYEGWAVAGEEKRKRLTIGQAYFERLKRTNSEQAALADCLPMARALFSEELEKAVETFKHQFWIVFVDVQSYIEDENGRDAEFSKRIRRGMYDATPKGEKNDVSDAVRDSVATIERICEPALRLD